MFATGHGEQIRYVAGLDVFDSLVVGAGAAGCVAARRLVDGGQRVLLVEAGGSLRPPALSTIDAVAALGEDEWFWPGIEALTDGRAELVRYRQGRGVGGGTAVNTLVMMA
ncbi:MAG: GMC family oxidoreductase N-terminal domain-containing protein, partial [Acidimicrobiia bacterium]|nr:GMC family oxidoreductase N-terminal domain-containing protein [Acidimicrobiia bacterium]